MSLIKKPMLAASMENSKGEEMTFADLKYPLEASIKLDGIRCLRIDGKTLSRSFKPIPNKFVQEQMALIPSHLELDGELITYNPDGSMRTFNQVQSDIMSEDGEPNFKFEIFDAVAGSLEKSYCLRIQYLIFISTSLPPFCTLVLPTTIINEDELLVYEEKAITDGHEGIMTRNPNGGYKCGRATFKSQDLIKIKRFKDSEAKILGFEEKLHNGNEATTDELGHTKRSSAKDGMVPANTLGALLVVDIHDGREFKIGTGDGLNDKLKKEIWDNQSKYLGKIVNYRYQVCGTKDKPRIPSFQGFRSEEDL